MLESDTVFADKGYHSEQNKDILERRNLTHRILHKRKRNEPENGTTLTRNKSIPKRRYVVDRTFG